MVTGVRPPSAPRLPATQPQDAQPHAPSAAPAPAGQSAAQPGQTLRDLAQNPEGQHPLGPAHAAPELSAAQKAAQQTNETLRQQLDPADWDAVLYQVEKNFGPGSFRNGIVVIDKAHAKKAGQRTRADYYGPRVNPNLRMSAAAAEKINETHGTKIDFGTIAKFEGGLALNGYVPWWPADLVVSKDGAISIDRATEEINGRNMLKGKDNRSGVTIGVGVDLGQQAPEAYKDRLRNFGIKQELIAKLEPYMGLIRGQAIEKLKEKPLSLSKQEVEQIVAEMKNEMLKDLVREYKDLTADIKNHRDFKELAIEEQTILFSRKWQNGNLQIPASKAIAKSFSLGLVRDALDKLVPANYPGQGKRIDKEHDYLEAWLSCIHEERHKVKPEGQEAK